MNGKPQLKTNLGPSIAAEELKHDLLPHRYRPDSSERFKCHSEEAGRLKTWIQEFLKQSNRSQPDQFSPSDDSYGSDSYSAQNGAGPLGQIISPRCVLLTGPPGVGKTSLVYTVANELKLHVIESHPSERRDAKLFNMLKLTNQKTKINTIAKLFQVAKIQQSNQQQKLEFISQVPETRRNKRRKLSETSSVSQNTPQQPIVVDDLEKPKTLSISGDTSIVLFDDIDVVFEEDGPFLKSLVEFIRETKRPVVLTATKSIDYIKAALIYFDQIHLHRPILYDCANLLKEICKQEKFKCLGKQLSRCQSIADNYNCDIRKSLNGIHFYGDKLDEILQTQSSYYNELNSNFMQLNLEKSEVDCNKDLLNCYTSQSIIDIIDNKFNLVNDSTLLERWLEGLPSVRNEEHNFYEHDLGEQIRESIVELTKKLYPNQLLNHQNVIEIKDSYLEIRQKSYDFADKINRKINSRIEPPDREFYIDIVPQIGNIINLEAKSRQVDSVTKGIFTSRRSRRTISYLDSINVYLDLEEINSMAKHLIFESSCSS